MTTVKVDFNSRGPHGWVRGSQRRADGPLDVNQVVTLVDADEDMQYGARVAEVDLATGRVFFDVHWRRTPERGVYIASGDLGARFLVSPELAPAEVPHWNDDEAGVRVSLAV